MRRPSRRSPILGCLVAALAAPAALQAAQGGWARFDDATRGLAAARAVTASEVPGDAAIASLDVDAGLLFIGGALGAEHGSRWSTVGVEIAPVDGEGPIDLREAGALRIRLASAVPRLLRVRVKGGDRQTSMAGCYPVVLQQVSADAVDYTIPLAAFAPPSWCGTRGASIGQTLRAVERVEITANDTPAGPVEFWVGPIDFVVEEQVAASAPAPASAPALAPAPASFPAARNGANAPSSAAAPRLPVAAPASAAGALPAASGAARRRPSPVAVPASAFTPGLVASAPGKRVICERNPRYELVLCY